MKLKNLTLIGAALLLSSPVFATTYYGGFEDAKGGDYDYNDIVFSIVGNGLTLNSAGKFYSAPVVNNNGVPFWDHSSFDNPSNGYNVGFCIYGGGACNNGTALSSGAKYLASASSTSVSANDVTFSVSGQVSTAITLGITAGDDTLGYYLLSDRIFHAFGPVGNTYTFTPGGDFGLAGKVANTGAIYASQTWLGTADSTSHFAFFTPAPEPGMMGLVGAGLLSVGAFFRRKKSAKV